MKDKYINTYMDFAKRVAQLSHARRLKVGAVLVKDHALVYGYNGMPSGWDNNCENKEYMSIDAGGWLSPLEIEQTWPYSEETPEFYRRYRLVTKPEVLHAEMNCLQKVNRSPLTSDGGILFCTHAPCMDCAKAIYQAGIKQVVYGEDYRSDDGLNFLRKCNVEVKKYE